ncbi:AbrB family transcriptional regulator [Vibrio salinus]|uniref:AbrB family transcriptional regulator n=1 Tax=Vibrio salinus TaxID=2899784 RepID=UPI001E4F1C60|nr:AbrB family transcriptional regulator [Vibrio salinus]MCE0495041.1 AbrB family transcriptional regulator [Vibrio salinus]
MNAVTTCKWIGLTLFSLINVIILEQFKLPAALMLGPMIAALTLASSGLKFRLNRRVFALAQGFVGMMIMEHLPTHAWQAFVHQWPIFLFGTLSTLLVSAIVSWYVAHAKRFPGSTAVWGISPGAASAMTLMSEGYGADMRIVAFMQYSRVVCCALATMFVARVAANATETGQPIIDWLALPLNLDILIKTLLILTGVYIGKRFALPGGALITPMVLGFVFNLIHPIPTPLPMTVLTLAYALLGWGIGFRFTKEVLRHVLHLLPIIFSSIFVLLTANVILAYIITLLVDVSFISAFLATSPGGVDSVAIISTSVNANVPFVMAMQLARFFAVMSLGPLIARWISMKYILH